MQLTFLNLTNAPSLNPADLKLVRGHVTKSNFERRRVRRAGGKGKGDEQGLHDESRAESAPSIPLTPARRKKYEAHVDMRHASEVFLVRALSEPDRDIRFLLTKYRPLVFPASLEESDTPDAGKWFALMRSEPALVEASMAIATRCGSTSSPFQSSQRATMHTYKAVNIISERLDRAPDALTDGLLGAVFTLSYSELLMKNRTAREAHVTGLAEMVRLRKNQTRSSLPKWFGDFLFHDSIGAVIASPDDYCTRVASAVGTPDSLPYIQAIASTAKGLAELGQHLDAFYTTPGNSSQKQVRMIQTRVDALVRGVRNLPRIESPYLWALEYSLRLYLSLMWPCSLDRATDVDLLHGLKESLGEPKIRLCAAVHLTVWQLFVGAVAARDHSEMKIWFLSRLAKTLVSMQVDSWERLLVVLEKTFMPDGRLLVEFKKVWNEAWASR